MKKMTVIGLILFTAMSANAGGPKLQPTQDQSGVEVNRQVASAAMESTLEGVKVQDDVRPMDLMHPMIQRMWFHEFQEHGPKI